MIIDTTSSALAIDPIALAAFRSCLSGELLDADAPSYEAARRLVNGRHDRRPALIARCRSAQDVAHAVAFAREHDLEIAVRSGGHSAPGHSVCDDGMLIDLSQMKNTAHAARRLVLRHGLHAAGAERRDN